METIKQSTCVLEVNELKLEFGQAVQTPLNFQLNSSSFVALSGRNGAGKTTLLKTVCGLVSPQSGTVKVLSQDIHTLSPFRKASVVSAAFTHQDAWGPISVREMIAIGRSPYTNLLGKLKEDDLSAIEEAVSLCQVSHLLDREVQSLSDGEKQKVAMARLLAQNTAFILLDEPTSHLDIVHKHEYFQLLKDLAHQRNKTILISTHEISLAQKYCDQQLWLSEEGIRNELPSEIKRFFD